MSTIKHTPTPWEVYRFTIQSAETEYRIAEVRQPDTRVRGKERMEDLEYCQGNAEFIVRACNAHDQLVAALQDARTRLIAYASITNERHPALRSIDTALAAAGAA